MIFGHQFAFILNPSQFFHRFILQKKKQKNINFYIGKHICIMLTFFLFIRPLKPFRFFKSLRNKKQKGTARAANNSRNVSNKSQGEMGRRKCSVVVMKRATMAAARTGNPQSNKQTVHIFLRLSKGWSCADLCVCKE